MENFHNRLKRLRKEFGYVQVDVAKNIKVTEQAYQAYERGANLPGFEKLIALADFYDISLDELVGRER